jgi:fatty acid desaturase
MTTTVTPEHDLPELRDPAFLRRVNALRTVDNYRSWFYLLREYLFLAAVIVSAIVFMERRADWGLPWLANLPVIVVAITLVGAGQHRLTGLTHEASHYLLFKNRYLNEIVSDVFCMFPLWSSTNFYRLQHLAHHQYVNDPVRDPDVAQLESSGHRFRFPMTRRQFVWECIVKQLLWPPGLFRYLRARAKYATTASGSGPYVPRGQRSKVMVTGGILYLLAQLVTLILLVRHGDPFRLAVVPGVMWIGIVSFYLAAPMRWFNVWLIRSPIPRRVEAILRISYLTGVLVGLAWLTHLTDRPYWLYYGLFWLVPLATSFSFYMMLRQVVSHGNADSGRLTNTRIFFMSPFFRFAVFPYGQEYHLPHHLFQLVPHHRLARLHMLLLELPGYRDNAIIVEGYLFPRHRPPTRPTVLDVMTQ